MIATPLRTLRFARELLRANLGWNRRPFKLTFALTDRCNARCLHCDIWRKETTEELSVAEIERLFRRAGQFAWIDLTGGEPFLRPDLVPVAAAILRHTPHLLHLHLPTNGLAPELTARRVGEILALDPPRLSITLSLDGPPELHDRLRGVAGNWDRVMALHRRLAALRDPRLQLFFGFTLSDANHDALDPAMRAVAALFPEVGHRQWHLNLAHHSEHYYGNTATPLFSPANRNAFLRTVRAFRDIKQGWRDPVAFLEGRYLTLALDFIRDGRTPLPCQAVRSSLFIAADGTCHPCSIWNRPLGNLRTHDFDLHALLADDPAREAIETIRQNKCPNCWTPCDAYPTILGSLL